MEKSLLQYTDTRILLIDDDASNNLLIEHILHNYGFKHVKSITDPRLAINIVLDYKPELMLLDLGMPHMNGFEVFLKIQELTPRKILPVIIVTAENDHRSKLQATNLGIQYFLEKPLNRNELLIRIQNILHINWLYNQIPQVDKLMEEKQELEYSMIKSLLLSLEFRNEETSGHVNRVSTLVYIMAKGIGLSEQKAERFAIASQLHDIGKIGIPDSILCKEDKLSDKEWKMMKSHTLIGAKILGANNSKILKLAAQIAKTHHENWDGSGYPKKLKGDSIPLAGRLTAVADVFDALMSDRPYKKAWDFDASVSYMLDESSLKFDPEIIKSFRENIEEIRSLYYMPIRHKKGKASNEILNK